MCRDRQRQVLAGQAGPDRVRELVGSRLEAGGKEHGLLVPQLDVRRRPPPARVDAAALHLLPDLRSRYGFARGAQAGVQRLRPRGERVLYDHVVGRVGRDQRHLDLNDVSDPGPRDRRARRFDIAIGPISRVRDTVGKPVFPADREAAIHGLELGHGQIGLQVRSVVHLARAGLPAAGRALEH